MGLVNMMSSISGCGRISSISCCGRESSISCCGRVSSINLWDNNMFGENSMDSINLGLIVFQRHWLSVETSLGSKVLDLGSLDTVGVLFFKEKMQKINSFKKSKYS